MMERQKTISRTCAALLAATGVLLSAATACSEKYEGSEDSEPVRFAATCSASVDTRADGSGRYVDSGPITNGQFCLGYNSTASSDRYRVADVDFDVSGLSGTGIGLVWTYDGYKELSWSEIYNSSVETFYMDNVLKKYNKNWKGSDHSNEHASEIVFKSGEHPFVAGLFDYTDGTNDLLWGTNQIRRNTNPIVMELHHYMAIVRVEITVDKTYYDGEGALDLSTANVTITNLVHEPYSFNRLDGSITLAEQPVREDLPMIDTKESAGSEKDWERIELDVREETTDDETGITTVRKMDIYTTKDFVLPPQGLPEKENRPQLIIETADGRIFSGILPNAMWELVDGDPVNPMSLNFLKEHKLTIRTRITLDPPDLAFLPVLVRDWVCKDTHIISGYQAGIYNGADFIKLMSIYTDKYSDAVLSNYGYIDNKTNQWVFSIFRTITLDYDSIFGMMKYDGTHPDFRFSLTDRYKVYVTKNGERYAVNADELKKIVSGES